MSPDFQLYYKEATVIEMVTYWLKKKKKIPRSMKQNTESEINPCLYGQLIYNHRAKYKQVGLPQLNVLLHSEGDHQQNEKAMYLMREDTCKHLIRG